MPKPRCRFRVNVSHGATCSRSFVIRHTNTKNVNIINQKDKHAFLKVVLHRYSDQVVRKNMPTKRDVFYGEGLNFR